MSLNEVGGEPRPLRGQRRGVPPQRRRAGAALADGDDDADHPRHQTRRRRAGPDRGAVPGARRCGPSWSRGWERAAPAPDPATGLFLWQNIFGVWPVAGTVDDVLRRPPARLRREGHPRGAPAHLVERPRHRIRSGGARLARRRPRRTGRRRADRARGAGSTRTPAATRWARSCWRSPCPGFPMSTRAPSCGRTASSTPTTAGPSTTRMRRAALEAAEHPEDPGGARRRCGCAATGRRRFLAGGYTPVLAAGAAAEHVVAFRRGDDVLVAVSRWTVRLDETGWGDTVLAAAGRLLDRPSDRSSVHTGPYRRRHAVRRTAGGAAGARRMPDHEFAVWAPIPERGAPRRRRRPAPDDPRRTTAGGAPPSTSPPMPATASCSTTTRRCCPIRARRASPTACTSARSCGPLPARPLDRRGLGGPLDRGRGDLRAARRHVHPGGHVRRGHRKAGPTWSISASTSSN